jgi:hypothetical protein
MLSDDITLLDIAGANSKTFTLVSINGTSTIRNDNAANNNYPYTISIKHEMTKRKGVPVRRSVVRLENNIQSSYLVGPADVNTIVPLIAQAVIEFPMGLASDAQMMDVVGRLYVLLGTSGVIDKLLNGES